MKRKSRFLLAIVVCLSLVPQYAGGQERAVVWNDQEGDSPLSLMGTDLVEGTIELRKPSLLFTVNQVSLPPEELASNQLQFVWAFRSGTNEYRVLAEPAAGDGKWSFRLQGNCAEGEAGDASCSDLETLKPGPSSETAFSFIVPLKAILGSPGTKIETTQGAAGSLCAICWVVGSGATHVVADEAEMTGTYPIPGKQRAGKNGPNKPRDPHPKKPDKRRPGAACKGVKVGPRNNLQHKLDKHRSGATFCLTPGTYRLTQGVRPKTHQRLFGTGRGNVIISGARPVKAKSVGRYWVIAGQRTLGKSEFSEGSQCRPVAGVDPKGMCVYRDQVFLGNKSLWQVGSLSELSRGEFYWNTASGNVYLAQNPRNKRLEVSVAAGPAISGPAPGVKIRNLVIEKFGNPVQTGAVSAAAGWRVSRTEVRLNHGGGIHMAPGTVLRRNFIHHNGQIGIHGGQERCAAAKGLKAIGNEISFNNIAGYNWGFEGGATKWTHTNGLVVKKNFVHHNYGMGLWTDAGNINTLYRGNVVKRNHGMGINHELSYAAVIKGNTVVGNGFHHPIQSGAWGGGIFIDQSRDVRIVRNRLIKNSAGITAVQEPAGSICNYGVAETTGLRALRNVVVQGRGVAAGLQVINTSEVRHYASGKNRWIRNKYRLHKPWKGTHFFWMRKKVEVRQWRNHGHDVKGRFGSV